jgi:hypothetical protein
LDLAPPVTTAVLPSRLTAATTSRAVVVGPNPVRRGFCSVSGIVCTDASIVSPLVKLIVSMPLSLRG